MALTVIPAPDMSGATAGWEMLARSVQRNQEHKRERETQYQNLILKLSAPDTTEEQQNAILTQDPKQFESFYGVPLAQVGKDVAQFRSAAKDIETPSGSEPAGSKRVLVPHPGGTDAQRKEAADLAQTQAQTRQTTTQTRATEAAIPIAQSDSRQRIANATMDIAKTMRTPDGKVPNYNQRMGYIAGNFDLVPTTDVQKKMEAIREILGVDGSTPEGRVVMHEFANTTKMSDLELDKTAADIRGTNALSALREQEYDLIAQGFNPKTGQPANAADAIDPKELMALGKGFTDALNSSLGPLGFSSQMTTERDSWYTSDWYTRKSTDNSKLLPAIFGNGVADPAVVRADLLAAVEPGRKLKTIDFPSFDPKTNRPITVNLTIDEAVPVVTQMRRQLTTSLPPVFAALMQASPQTLLYMISGNPLIEQAAKAYAPQLADAIARARATVGAGGGASGAPGAQADPNLAPLLPDLKRLQGEVDSIKLLLQGKATPPPPQ